MDQIFENLSHDDVRRYSQVCTRWFAVARQPKFFKPLDLDVDYDRRLAFEDIFFSAEVFPFNEIKINYSKIDVATLSSKYFPFFERHQENIRVLEFTIDYSKYLMQFDWINKFSHLSKLAIGGNIHVIIKSEKLKQFINSGLRSMETVKFLETTSLELIQMLQSKLPNLEKTSVATLIESTAQAEIIDSLLNNSPNLKIEFDELIVADYLIFLHLAAHQKFIVHSLLTEFEFIDLNVWRDLTKNQTQIKSLEMRTFNDWNATDCVKSLPNLQNLKMSTFVGTITTSFSFKNLTKLELEGLDGSIFDINEPCDLQSLQNLVIHEAYLSVEAFEFLGRGCPNLTSLSINLLENRHESGMTDDHLQLVWQNLTQLESLELEELNEVTEVGFSNENASIRDLQHLKSLHLGGVSILTDNVLIASFKFPKLIKLSLKTYETLPITDIGLEAIATSCSQLQQLSLNSLPSITDDGIKTLRERLINLKTLEIKHCDGVTTEL